MSKTILSFQTLDVYQCTIQFIDLTHNMVETLPRGHARLIDQLMRAATSISLNIAEGYGKRSSRDRKNFYGIARGSAMECAAAYDVFRVRGLVSSAIYEQAIGLLDRVIAMLSKMCK